MNPVSLIVAGLAALAILLIAVAVAAREGDVIDDRVGRYGAAQRVEAPKAPPRLTFSTVVAGSHALATINTLVERQTFASRIARDLARADLQLKVSEFLLIRVVVVVAVPLALLVAALLIPNLGSPLALMLGVLLAAWLPGYWVQRRISRRLREFDSQLPDTITLIANALRAGSSFLQAVDLVVREQPPPMSTEFNRVIREVNLGLPFEQALDNLVRRVRSDDLELMATAISIQHQVGGNLAEILDSIAFTIRERVRIKGEIRTLTAQQRLSGYVVGFLPIGMAAVLLVMIPRFMRPMFSNPPAILGLPAGVVLLFLGAVMMLTGFAIIRRIVDIDI